MATVFIFVCSLPVLRKQLHYLLCTARRSAPCFHHLFPFQSSSRSLWLQADTRPQLAGQTAACPKNSALTCQTFFAYVKWKSRWSHLNTSLSSQWLHCVDTLACYLTECQALVSTNTHFRNILSFTEDLAPSL